MSKSEQKCSSCEIVQRIQGAPAELSGTSGKNIVWENSDCIFTDFLCNSSVLQHQKHDLK